MPVPLRAVPVSRFARSRLLRLAGAALAVGLSAGCLNADARNAAVVETGGLEAPAEVGSKQEAALRDAAVKDQNRNKADKSDATDKKTAEQRRPTGESARPGKRATPERVAALGNASAGAATTPPAADPGTNASGTGTAAIPARSGTGRRVIYSISRQRVWLVKDGDVLDRSYLVSGQIGQPGPGSYRVYSKSRHARSAVQPPATMQYMIRFARGKATGAPIGFHDIPRMLNGKYEQTVSQLGQPLSAGCVRQQVSDAKYLWSWAPVGTKVVVLR